jgi:hypothetical protein
VTDAGVPDADLPDDAESPAAAPEPSGRTLAPRSIKRSLASIVLGFELIVVFLAALVNFGLPTAGVISIGPVAALVSGATALFSAWPARRAAHADPVAALNSQT